MVVVLFQQVYVMCFLGSEHPAEKLHHILTFPSKRKTGGKKNSPAKPDELSLL